MNATIAVLLFTLSASAPENLATDQVDLVEINHFHDEQGRLVFDQVIYYDWSAADGRYQVRAWRLLKSARQVPQRNWQRNNFEAIWQDGDIVRRVRAKAISETWTQYDPELVERDHLPKERRRELSEMKMVTRRGDNP